MSCTYVTGFWEVKNNVKHNMIHYKKHIPKTLNRLRYKNVIFFYEDDEILRYIKKYSKNTNFISVKLPLIKLPTYELSYDLLNSCKNQDNAYLKSINNQREKGLNHYNREYLKSGEDAYRGIISIWTSKVLLIEKVIELNPFNSDVFFWCDSAITKFKFNIRKINYNMNVINTNPSYGKYMGELLKHSAGLMISSKSTWLILIELYKNKLNEIKDSNYAHDEETILYLIYKENNNLFDNTILRRD
jgi:hypothetical protein